MYSDFIRENAIEITNKHAPKWETDLPKVQDFILSTSYGMLPLLTYTFPEDRDVTAEDIEDFKKHQKMAFVAARGFNVAYELVGNLRKADWYNQVKNQDQKWFSKSREKTILTSSFSAVQLRCAVQASQTHHHEPFWRIRHRQRYDGSDSSVQRRL
jgi:hypothetical protein